MQFYPISAISENNLQSYAFHTSNSDIHSCHSYDYIDHYFMVNDTKNHKY